MKIILNKGQRLFFTSDTHYGQSNIVLNHTTWNDTSGCRKFINVDYMNTHMVNMINETVGENDILVHLGDWSFGGFEKIAEFRNRIHCKNIHLFLGNHDKHIKLNHENIQSIFSSVNTIEYLTIVKHDESINKHEKLRFILSHYPIASWEDMNKGVMHLYGHIHTSSRHIVGPGKMMDVGVDGSKFRPWSLEQIVNKLKKQKIQSLIQNNQDHHI